MNTACPRRVSLISALGLPTILSPTIGATTGDRPAARRFGSRLSPALQASSFARRLAHPHRPNRVHRGCPLGQPVLRTGRSRSVALHPALLRCSYGSIPHSSSPHRSGLSPLYPTALSGARAPTCSRLCVARNLGGRSYTRASLVLWVVSPVTYGAAVRTFLGAKRLECAELAPAFRAPTLNDSASKLDALQTLRATGMPVLSNVTIFTAANT